MHWNISGNMSLVSAGRINQDTPPLTTPSRTSKSSAMDTSSHTFEIVIRRGATERFRLEANLRLVRCKAKKAYLYSCKTCEGKCRHFSAWILT